MSGKHKKYWKNLTAVTASFLGIDVSIYEVWFDFLTIILIQN